MRVWQVILFSVVAGSALPVLAHHHQHGVINPYQVVLAAFLWINVIIALWELCLLARIDHVAAQHRRYVAEYRGREIARVRDFILAKVSQRELLSPTFWSDVWASYSVFDASYADRRSYGFFVDVGNGLTTLIPSLLFLHAMTSAALPARALGVVGIVLFYQMWYGTVIYLLSFFFNRRHAGHPRSHIALIIGVSNGLWLVAAPIGLYASIALVYSDSYEIFLR